MFASEHDGLHSAEFVATLEDSRFTVRLVFWTQPPADQALERHDPGSTAVQLGHSNTLSGEMGEFAFGPRKATIRRVASVLSVAVDDLVRHEVAPPRSPENVEQIASVIAAVADGSGHRRVRRKLSTNRTLRSS